MKNLILITLVLFGLNTIQANTEPVLASKNVIATSGLKLRTIPGMDGQVITIIPFGEEVKIIEHTSIEEIIEWRTGHWVKISYDGELGYLFDGFLSGLPIPSNQSLADSDLEMSAPLIEWIDNNYSQTISPDTICSENIYKVTKYYENGHRLIIKDNDYTHRVFLEMNDVKLLEVYNLILSLIEEKEDRSILLESSTFVANKQKDIVQIKIQGYFPITISKQNDDLIKVEITSYNTGC